MRAEVGEKIYIYDPSPAVVEWCRGNLTLDNPDYIKKMRMGLWTGNTPKVLILYEKTDEYISVPFGCLQKLHEYFPDMPMRSHIRPLERVEYDSHINLYGYQKKAVEAILGTRNGIIVMPCGAGKTQTALDTISRIGMPALWLTHTQDLLTQSYGRAKAVLGVDTKTYGMITDGKVDIGSGITFATVQTASKIDLRPYKDSFGCIIVDECHRAVGSPTKAMQFYRVLSQLSCRYKIGITATPKRADGMSRTMFALLGDVVHEVSRAEVARNTCPVEVFQYETGYQPDVDVVLCGDGTINYSSLITDLTHNEKRMDFVSNVINDIPAGNSILVLANRVEYLQTLQKKCAGKKSVCLSGMGTNKKARAERKEALSALNNCEIDVLFATYQLAKEGLDVPNLRYVVFATPEKDESTVIQAAGRVARCYAGKEKGIVLDMVDDFGMYLGWAKKRRSIYEKKLDFKINIDKNV